MRHLFGEGGAQATLAVLFQVPPVLVHRVVRFKTYPKF